MYRKGKIFHETFINLKVAEFKESGKIYNMSRKKVLIPIIIVSFLILVGSFFYFNGTFTKSRGQKQENINIPDQKNVISEVTFTKIPVSAVIDNHPGALPQKGLQDASIIWEILAEGGITRLLAVFTDRLPQLAGPVRSARTYFNTIANQYGGLYLHSGGAPDALEELALKTFSFTDVNEFSNGSTFFRDSKRKAPHNLFTTNQQLERFIASKSIAPRAQTLYQTSLQPQQGTPIQKLSIPFSPANTESFIWQDSAWRKTVNDKDWVDETGKPLMFDSIVILSIKDVLVPHPTEPDFRKYVFTDGEVRLLRDAKEIRGRWNMNEQGRLELRHTNGELLYLKKGKILFLLVPVRISITNEETLK